MISIPAMRGQHAEQAQAVEVVGVASFPPPILQNPYQRLLYHSLARYGYTLDPGGRMKVRWLLRSRRRVSILHFHWPQSYYRHERGPAWLRPICSWLRLLLFAGRLRAARMLGYRIAWTIHQVVPHEGSSRRLDRAAARLLARSSGVLIAHDLDTFVAARRTIGRSPLCERHAFVIPHGTFGDVYTPGRDRAAVRRELGISDTAFVFLSFGHIRAYKSIEILVEAFERAALDDAALIVAGMPLDDAVADGLRDAAAGDPRIVPLLAFVPDDQVAELHGAADVAVLPRGDGGTSGSLVLALSLGLPVIAADTPVYGDLTEGGSLGWLFRPGDPASLAAALEAAAGGSAATRRREAVRASPGGEGWDAVGAATHAAFAGMLA